MLPFRTRAMLPIRRFAERSKQPVEDLLLVLGKKWTLRWFGHVLMSSGLAKMILHVTVKGKRNEEDRRRDVKRQY